MNESQKKILADLVASHGSIPLIRTYMYKRCNLRINKSAVETARNDFTIRSLQEIGVDPTGSACDRLLSFFRNRDDVSFIAVSHTVDSGYVTMKKTAQDVNSVEMKSQENECIHHDEVLSWRNALKIEDGTKILVAVAWMHKSNQYYCY